MATVVPPLPLVPLHFGTNLTAPSSAVPSGRDTFSFPFPLSVQTWAVQMVVFHAVGLLFEAMDHVPALRSSKVRATRKSQYMHLLPNVLRNQILVLLPFMFLMEVFGLAFVGPSLHPIRFLVNLPLMALGHEIIQYVGHRYILHAPNVFLMKFLRHSVHHSTRASSAISACYMSPIDFFIEIGCPYLVPLSLVGGGGSGRFFHFLIAGAGAIGGLYEHSGYDFAVSFRPKFENLGEKPMSEQEKETAYKLLERPSFVTTFLADFLDNRAHLEHHMRGYVSFSDGFGSPSILDTLLRTKWDLSDRRRADVEREWARQHRDE
ncbi:hypothetical protein CcaverHIS002_0705650 [Cutaneotrichosporon cavernicola]|nr:hypothetical protein CcaverHIS002_0705650 [Cutaneotrichosporon cavernicola]